MTFQKLALLSNGCAKGMDPFWCPNKKPPKKNRTWDKQAERLCAILTGGFVKRTLKLGEYPRCHREHLRNAPPKNIQSTQTNPRIPVSPLTSTQKLRIHGQNPRLAQFSQIPSRHSSPRGGFCVGPPEECAVLESNSISSISSGA